MATQQEELKIRTGFDNTALAAGVREAKSIVSKGFGEIGQHITRMFAAGAAIAGIEKVLDKFEALQTRAENLDVSTDFLQGMSQIAKKDAVGGVEVFNRAIGDLSVKLGEVKSGNAETIKEFKKWGLTISDIAGLNAEQMFYKIADTIKGIKDPAQRSAAAFDLLGKSGKNLTGVLANGSEALKGMVDAVDKLDAEKIKALAEAKNTLDDLGNTATIWGGRIIALFTSDIPKALGQLSTGLSTVKKSITEEAHQWIEKIKLDSKNRVEAEIAAEEDAAQKISDAKNKSDDERIKKADEVYDKFQKHEDDEADRLFKIEWLKKNIAALDEKSVEFHEARARLAELEAEQQKKITNEAESQAKWKKWSDDADKKYQSDIRSKGAAVSEGTIPSVSDAAGANFVRNLEKDYGKGGRFDLTKGDGIGGSAARDLLLSQKQAQYDFTYFGRDSKQYENDLKKINSAKNQLMDLGILPDTRDMRNISKATVDSEKHLAALADSFATGKATVTIASD